MRKVLIIITLAVIATSCVTQRQCNKKFPPAVHVIQKDSINTNTVSQLVSKDTVKIYIRDSIYIHHKGDTVFKNVYKTQYIDKIQLLTVHDTIRAYIKGDKGETEIVEVNILTKFQKFQILVFWILAAAIFVTIIYKLSKFIK